MSEMVKLRNNPGAVVTFLPSSLYGRATCGFPDCGEAAFAGVVFEDGSGEKYAPRVYCPSHIGYDLWLAYAEAKLTL